MPLRNFGTQSVRISMMSRTQAVTKNVHATEAVSSKVERVLHALLSAAGQDFDRALLSAIKLIRYVNAESAAAKATSTRALHVFKT